MENLARAGAHVIAADPQASSPARKRIEQAGLAASVTLTDDHHESARGVDAIVVATEWNVFCEEDPTVIAPLVSNKLVVDGRNTLDSKAWKAAGFTYRGMGRS